MSRSDGLAPVVVAHVSGSHCVWLAQATLVERLRTAGPLLDSSRPVCLVGGPGTGKKSVAKAFADAAGRACVVVDAMHLASKEPGATRISADLPLACTSRVGVVAVM